MKSGMNNGKLEITSGKNGVWVTASFRNEGISIPLSDDDLLLLYKAIGEIAKARTGYHDYCEHQENITRPVLSFDAWLTAERKLAALHERYEKGEISAGELDCSETWRLEYELGA